MIIEKYVIMKKMVWSSHYFVASSMICDKVKLMNIYHSFSSSERVA